jgi:hypothetical protein
MNEKPPPFVVFALDFALRCIFLFALFFFFLQKSGLGSFFGEREGRKEADDVRRERGREGGGSFVLGSRYQADSGPKVQ